MTEQSQVPQPTELVYPPRASWLPMFVAVGLAALMVGTFKGRLYAVVGGVILLIALKIWLSDTLDGVSRLPRRQKLTSAVIPAQTLKRQ